MGIWFRNLCRAQRRAHRGRWNSEGGRRRRSSILCLIFLEGHKPFEPSPNIQPCMGVGRGYLSFLWLYKEGTVMENWLEDEEDVCLKIALWTNISLLEITLVSLPPWVPMRFAAFCSTFCVYIGFPGPVGQSLVTTLRKTTHFASCPCGCELMFLFISSEFPQLLSFQKKVTDNTFERDQPAGGWGSPPEIILAFKSKTSNTRKGHWNNSFIIHTLSICGESILIGYLHTISYLVDVTNIL